MSYIGGKPSKELASPTSQYFNGDGSTVAFTLDRPVNVAEDLDVFVSNVRQEPGSGKSYTATGTTLTFDAAPPSGTGNVYVVYRGLAEVTTRLEHDANAALAATTGTFSGALSATTGTFTGNVDINGYVGIGTTSPATATGGGIDIEKAGGASVRLDDTTNSVTGELQVYSAGMNLATVTSNDLIFSTNNTQRMRIEAGGDRIFYGDASSRNTEITEGGQLVGGIGARTTSGTANWNDATNARSGSGYTLLLGTATNGPGGNYYFHAFSFEYSHKNGSGNITQWAIGYNLNSARYQRYRYGGTWTSWVSF